MKGSESNTRSGNAHINKRSYRNHRQNVFVKLGKKWGVSGIVVERYRRYRHRADCPTCVTDGRDEALLHLVAHELGHGLCGFQGDMTGEYRCELFAASCLEEYRLATRDPACMI